MSDRLAVAIKGSKAWESLVKSADIMIDWGQSKPPMGEVTFGLLRLSRLGGPHRVFVQEAWMLPFVKSCDDWLHQHTLELGYWIEPSFEVFSDG